MSPQQINYQPLQQLGNAWQQVVRSSFGGYGLIIGSIIVFVGVVLVFAFEGLGLILLLPYLFVITNRVQKAEDNIWHQFAQLNNFSILNYSAMQSIVPPSLQKAGNSRQNGEAVSGIISNISFDIFWFEFTIGSGKDSRSFPLTVVRLQINAKLPYMLLRPVKALTSGDTRQLKEHLKLEGDFNKYFQVFSQPDMEVDDLVILTPDVMQYLIQQDLNYNIETSGNSLYIMRDGDLRRLAEMPKLLDFSLKTYDQILRNLPMAQLAETNATPIANPQTA